MDYPFIDLYNEYWHSLQAHNLTFKILPHTCNTTLHCFKKNCTVHCLCRCLFPGDTLQLPMIQFSPVYLCCHGITFLDWSHDMLSTESSLSYNCSATTANSSIEHEQKFHTVWCMAFSNSLFITTWPLNWRIHYQIEIDIWGSICWWTNH